MGKRGPRGKLARVKRLEGNPGKRPIKDGGVKGLGDPVAPEHMSRDARDAFHLIRASMPPGIYCTLDTYLLTAFCEAWAWHKRAVEAVGKKGFNPIVMSSRGIKRMHPWINVMADHARLMASLGDRLGLDPKSREALNMPRASEAESEFSGLLGRNESSTLYKN